MPRFQIVQTLTTSFDSAVSRITDLVLHPGGGTLYGTTRLDGHKAAWDISGTQLTQLDRDTFATGALPGSVPGLAFVPTGQGLALLAAGGVAGRMTLHSLQSDGRFGAETTLPPDSSFAGTLSQPAALTHADGTTTVYGGVQGGNGLAQLIFDAAGQLTTTRITLDTGSVSLRNVTALATADHAGRQFIFTAGQEDLGVTAFERLNNGFVTPRDTLNVDDGLWINAPSAMVTGMVGTALYLVLGAAGSSSLSVMAVGPDGALTLTSHIIDDRTTRFDGVTALTSVTHAGQTYIFAGGADDGISAFLLLPGGVLLDQGSIADTPDITLANISAIAGQSRGAGIDLFVTSGTEAGLTRLRVEIDPNTQVLHGTAAAETLTGGTGDDVITDGGGRDTLTGGAGADVFVLSADGAADVITDFAVGVDRIDLAGWPNLRDISQLTLTSLADGLRITYGAEELTLRSADGKPIAPTALSTSDLIGPARLPAVAVAGAQAPITDPPALPDRPETPVFVPDPPPLPEGVELIGAEFNDTLQGGTGDDLIFGQSGRDRLLGGDGADLLFGGTDADVILGEAGDDQLYGGGGRDSGWQSLNGRAGTNGDQLYGGAGNDSLYGMAGDDRLDGGTGDDILTGGAGRDTFVFRSGRDQVTDFMPETDRLQLDDALWSGTKTAAQVIAQMGRISGGDAYLTFENGHSLTLTDISDLAALATRIDII